MWLNHIFIGGAPKCLWKKEFLQAGSQQLAKSIFVGGCYVVREQKQKSQKKKKLFETLVQIHPSRCQIREGGGNHCWIHEAEGCCHRCRCNLPPLSSSLRPHLTRGWRWRIREGEGHCRHRRCSPPSHRRDPAAPKASGADPLLPR